MVRRVVRVTHSGRGSSATSGHLHQLMVTLAADFILLLTWPFSVQGTRSERERERGYGP